MERLRISLVIGAALFAFAAAQMFATTSLASDLAGLRYLETVNVAGAVDGDTLRLNDGREVRMVGIQAPKLPLGRKNFTAWPLAEEARKHLEQLMSDRPVSLYGGGATQDRHGRILAHVKTAEGIWLQREMLRAGFARVYSFADNRAALDPLYTTEETARGARLGIWKHPYYAIHSAVEISMAGLAASSKFVLVEGTPLRITHRGRATYVDFGDDWRRDFSLRILSKNRRNFGVDEESGKVALDNLVGKSMRVRGWAYRKNGVMIDIDHPEAIELLGNIEMSNKE